MGYYIPGHHSMTIWCDNGQCGWNSHLTDEPGEGEECYCIHDIELSRNQAWVRNLDDHVVYCESFTPRPTKAEVNTP